MLLKVKEIYLNQIYVDNVPALRIYNLRRSPMKIKQIPPDKSTGSQSVRSTALPKLSTTVELHHYGPSSTNFLIF